MEPGTWKRRNGSCGKFVRSPEEDGLEFLAETVRAELIREEQEYGGTRVTFQALLGSARIHLRLDFGYGDAVIPEPAVEEYPTLLDMPAPKLLMYPSKLSSRKSSRRWWISE